MAKVSLARKKELNEPDEFINMSNRVLNFVIKNKNLMMSSVVAVVVTLVSVAGYLYYSDFVEKKAFVQLSDDMDWYESETDGKSRSLDEIKAKSDVFFKDYSRTVAGKLALARYAEIFYSEGDYKSAVDLYEKLLKKSDSSVDNLVLSSLGQSYEALDQYDDAIACFEKIIKSDNSLGKDTALFHLGLMYEKKGNSELSIEQYKSLVADYNGSVYIEIAKEKAVAK